MLFQTASDVGDRNRNTARSNSQQNYKTSYVSNAAKEWLEADLSRHRSVRVDLNRVLAQSNWTDIGEADEFRNPLNRRRRVFEVWRIVFRDRTVLERLLLAW